MNDLTQFRASGGIRGMGMGNKKQRDLFALGEMIRRICPIPGCLPYASPENFRWMCMATPPIVTTPISEPAMTDDSERNTQAMIPSDADLIRGMAEGDASAFSQFYSRHSTLLFSIAIKVLGDRLEAEEAWQDAARTIWEHAPLYQASLGKPLSWAVVITRNKAIDRLRALQRRSEGIERVMAEATVGFREQEIPVANIAIGKESAAALRTALGALPSEQRVAIELAFFKGLSQSEIAIQLGQPLGTIKARIRRGMIALRDVLEESL